MQLLGGIPRGGGLPSVEFHRRHRALVGVLWGCIAGLLAYSAADGYAPSHLLLHVAPLLGFALLASSGRPGRHFRAACTSLGLLTAAALFVHATDGLIEAHFAFFVFIIALTLYEEWTPFLLAVGYVLLHHGLVGTLEPDAVYSGRSLAGSPWKWAGVHAAFVAAAGSAGVIVWSFNEKLREEREGLLGKLQVLAVKDGLTGLANRRAWEEHFGQELRRAARTGEPLSLAVIDVDDLKEVNDLRGHHAGDRLLRECASAWQAGLRENDFLARLGGDEFGVILPNCRSGCAQRVAERMRETAPPGHSFSIGIACWDRQEPARDLMRRADEALYRAKGAGRGLVTLAA